MPVVFLERIAGPDGQLLSQVRAILFGDGFELEPHLADSLVGSPGANGGVTGYYKINVTGTADGTVFRSDGATPPAATIGPNAGLVSLTVLDATGAPALVLTGSSARLRSVGGFVTTDASGTPSAPASGQVLVYSRAQRVEIKDAGGSRVARIGADDTTFGLDGVALWQVMNDDGGAPMIRVDNGDSSIHLAESSGAGVTIHGPTTIAPSASIQEQTYTQTGTTSGAATFVVTMPVPANSSAHFLVEITGLHVIDSTHIDVWSASQEIIAKRPASGAVQAIDQPYGGVIGGGGSAPPWIPAPIATDASLSTVAISDPAISGGNVTWTVTGVAATTIHWTAKVKADVRTY